ncbi:hypothetical protein Ancab_030570 [Ancistrocladus abbreviatus]
MASSNPASSDLVSSVISFFLSLRSVPQIFINVREILLICVHILQREKLKLTESIIAGVHESMEKMLSNELQRLELLKEFDVRYWESKMKAQAKIYRNVLCLITSIPPICHVSISSSLSWEEAHVHELISVLQTVAVEEAGDDAWSWGTLGQGPYKLQDASSEKAVQEQKANEESVLWELEDLSNYLLVKIGKARFEFVNARTNLWQRQKDVTPSLNDWLQDASNDKKAVQEQKVNEESAQDIKSEAANTKISSGENDAEDSMNESTKSGAEISLAKL